MSEIDETKFMAEEQNNFAYIDGANLYEAMKELKLPLNYKRFRIWLSEKYNVKRAYIFIGLIPKYKNLYTYINDKRSILQVQKEKAPDGDGTPQGSSPW